MNRRTAIAVLLTLLSAPSALGEVPDILQHSIENRTNFKTARLAYRRIETEPGTAPLVENTEIRFEDDDSFTIDYGDDDGIRMHNPPTGTPLLGVTGSCVPSYTVYSSKKDELWSDFASAQNMVHESGPWREATQDIRALGLYPYDVQNKSPSEILDMLNKGKYDWFVENTDTGMQRVTCRSIPSEGSSGRRIEIEWLIDPSEGHSIRDAFLYGIQPDTTRSILSEIHSTFEQSDGRWWPKRSELSVSRSGRRVVVDFTTAEFDRPDHPRNFGGDLLGVPVGMPVVEKGDSSVTGWRHYIGNDQIISDSKWKSDKNSFDKNALLDFLRARARRGNGSYPVWWNDSSGYFGISSDAPYRPDAWETYVRRWLLHHSPPITESHQLGPAAIESAWAILKDCRKRAEPIRTRLDRKLAELANRSTSMQPGESDSVAQSGASPTEGSASGRSRAMQPQGQDDELRHPAEIEHIFRELCGRLEALLSESQREASAETSEKSSLRVPAAPGR